MKRISMWSGPRNVSTAIMYSFAQRPDTKVVDEPLYGYYLKHTGADHPGLLKLVDQLNTNEKLTIQEMLNHDYSSDIVFFKNMAHHLIDLNMDFLSGFSNLILIRDPKQVLISLSKTLGKIELIDTAFEFQWEIYSKLKNMKAETFIIDSRDLLSNPENYLILLCEKLKIPFYESMLSWRPGGIKEDGLWAEYWYHNVHKSSGFQPLKETNEELPKDLEQLYIQCNEYYRMLTDNKLAIQ